MKQRRSVCLLSQHTSTTAVQFDAAPNIEACAVLIALCNTGEQMLWLLRRALLLRCYFALCLVKIVCSLSPERCSNYTLLTLFSALLSTGAGHIIGISSKSGFISLIPFKKCKVYIIFIHYTQTDIFQMFISKNVDDYNCRLRKIPPPHLPLHNTP